MSKVRMRDVVVVLPGITGSVLQRDGHDIWAPSAQAAWNGLTTFGGSLRELVLAGDDPEADDIGDGIRATRLVDDVHMIPGLVKIDGYTSIRVLVKENFDVVEGRFDDDSPANFIEYPYDWRRDNRVAARGLARLVQNKLPRWREDSGEDDAKVILIAHSMGGLVARYYLEKLNGWRECRALITFGTPHRGSVDALGYLANGYKKLFIDLSQVLQSCTSVYQLLPIYTMLQVHGQLVRPAELEHVQWLVHSRAVRAREFHTEIEDAVNEHLRDQAYLKDRYAQIPIVGVAQKTMQSAHIKDGKVSISEGLPPGVDPLLAGGDGTVPRLSAIPIELSNDHRNSFIAEKHGSLQKNFTVWDDLIQRLRQMQVIGLEKLRGEVESPLYGEVARRPSGEKPGIRLDVDDAYAADEPVAIQANLVNCSRGQLRGVLEPADGSNPGRRLDFRREGGVEVAAAGCLPPGTYRVEVSATNTPERTPDVHDIFAVVPATGTAS